MQFSPNKNSNSIRFSAKKCNSFAVLRHERRRKQRNSAAWKGGALDASFLRSDSAEFADEEVPDEYHAAARDHARDCASQRNSPRRACWRACKDRADCDRHATFAMMAIKRALDLQTGMRSVSFDRAIMMNKINNSQCIIRRSVAKKPHKQCANQTSFVGLTRIE